MTLLETFEERFWAKVDRSGDCWSWMGRIRSDGYGQLSRGRGRTLKAHRVAWELTNGPIPPGLWVLHRCDNPPCCNPAHLFLGTHVDNMADAKAKGRCNAGHRSRAKLTEARVEQLRRALARGINQRAIAREFGVCQSSVSAINRGVIWRVLR